MFSRDLKYLNVIEKDKICLRILLRREGRTFRFGGWSQRFDKKVNDTVQNS